jgi:hypothetical protein
MRSVSAVRTTSPSTQGEAGNGGESAEVEAAVASRPSAPSSSEGGLLTAAHEHVHLGCAPR